MYCKYLDQDNHEYTHKYIRETATGGVGKVILFREQKMESIGVTCTYAIDYLKQHFF